VCAGRERQRRGQAHALRVHLFCCSALGLDLLARNNTDGTIAQVKLERCALTGPGGRRSAALRLGDQAQGTLARVSARGFAHALLLRGAPRVAHLPPACPACPGAPAPQRPSADARWRQVAVVEGCSLDAPGGLFAAWDELSAQARAQFGPDNAMRSSPLVCHSPHPSLRLVLQTESRWTEAPQPHAGEEGASDAPAPAPAPAPAARAPGQRPPGLAPLLLPAAPGLRSPPLHPSASPGGGPAARMGWGSSGSALSSDGNSDSLSARAPSDASAGRSESLSRGSSLAEDAAPTAAGGATAGGAGPDEPAPCPPPTTPRRAPRAPRPGLLPAGAVPGCSPKGAVPGCSPKPRAARIAAAGADVDAAPARLWGAAEAPRAVGARGAAGKGAAGGGASSSPADLPPAGAGFWSVAGSLSSEAGPKTGGGNDSDNSL